jgi:long-chain acyl-CoA synthetase
MKNSITRIFQLEQFIKKHNNNCVLAGKIDGKWRKYSASEFCETSDAIAYGLLNMGIEKGDKIALISTNRPEWALVDFAIAKIGAINVPIYPNITTEDYQYILDDCQAKIMIAGSDEIYNKVKDLTKTVNSLEKIFTFDPIDGTESWTKISDLGRENPQTSKVKSIQVEVKSEELFTLIYTSGTTGNPKGVMLSHHNLLSQLDALEYAFPWGKEDKALSFLPLCHVFERVILYYYLKRGVQIYYAESIESIGDNLKEVSPTIMPTVPRLLEKVYDKIIAKGAALTGIKKALFFWAIDLGLKHEHDGKNGWWYEYKLSIANKLIFSKWREALGNNMNYIISGAAALQPRLAKIFTAAQIPVYEGYGLTETSPVIAVNTPKTNEHHYATVGPVIQGVEVKFANDGEILCRGSNVMMGYYNAPEKTAETIKDGWFHTGDIGELIDGKFLKITDRKKEIFKTSGGKYIAPQVMENKFKESIFIEQIMVIGEGEKHPAAFIVPEFNTLQEWCRRHDIEYTSNEEMVTDERIIKRYQDEVDRLNTDFSNYEKIKKFIIFPSSWGVDTGELTATMKLRRKPILSKYQSAYENIYGLNN